MRCQESSSGSILCAMDGVKQPKPINYHLLRALAAYTAIKVFEDEEMFNALMEDNFTVVFEAYEGETIKSEHYGKSGHYNLPDAKGET